jgi:hypothetical protein
MFEHQIQVISRIINTNLATINEREIRDLRLAKRTIDSQAEVSHELFI